MRLGYTNKKQLKMRIGLQTDEVVDQCRVGTMKLGL